ncbi:hypothetical protein GCM10007852_10100 [Agaribacter marinus]|uniref:Uncharacterized protein n=1 Tax=Agaribacter marinus TaxID=1431249 RepID=A0AA37SW14_9ALTE|nr:hypothetical protein GCM10007852_10100 [Agaribacter marinus]
MNKPTQINENRNIGKPILSLIGKGKYVVIPGIITVAVINDINIAAKCRDFVLENVYFFDVLLIEASRYYSVT